MEYMIIRRGRWKVVLLTHRHTCLFVKKISFVYLSHVSTHHLHLLPNFFFPSKNKQLDSLEMMPHDLFSPLLLDVLVNPVSWCVL